MAALYPWLLGFLLTLFRCAALCGTAPVFSMRSIPMQPRMAIALGISFAVYAGAGYPRFDPGAGLGPLVVAILSESIIGLAVGTAAKLALEAAFVAGHLAASAMGLGFGAIIDPIDGAESTTVQELLSMMAAGAFLLAGGHREAVAWLCRSLIESPPGTSIEMRDIAPHVITAALGGISLAIRLAYPILAAVLIGQSVLGILGRAAPQLNISSIGFSVSILAGGGVLYVTAPIMAELAARQAVAIFARGG